MIILNGKELTKKSNEGTSSIKLVKEIIYETSSKELIIDKTFIKPNHAYFIYGFVSDGIIDDASVYMYIIDSTTKKIYSYATIANNNGTGEGHVLYYLDSNNVVLGEKYINGEEISNLAIKIGMDFGVPSSSDNISFPPVGTKVALYQIV